MPSIWVDSLGRSFEQALGMLAEAAQTFTDALWETPMWQVSAPNPGHQFFASDWSPVTHPAQRRALAERWVQRWATPWSVAWHALELLDYDLTGEFGPWSPPPPFAGRSHWRDLPILPAAWSRSEVIGYIDYCRQRVRDTLAGMTDEKGAAPLPRAHRYRGQPHAWLITDLVGHTTEHASQIRQFITPAGTPPGM